MKQKALIFIVLIMAIGPLFAQKITTLAPAINRKSRENLIISKIQLTKDFTIVYCTFENDGNIPAGVPPQLRQLLKRFPQSGSNIESSATIEIDPKVYLYESKNPDKTYKFVKAEGIPVKPAKRKLLDDESVDFVLYFQRLEAGIELFNLFEGEDDGNYQFWNFYGIHIRNPKPVAPTPAAKPVAKPVVIAKTDSIKTVVADTLEVTKPTLADKKLSVGEAVRLNNIYFEVGKADLLPASFVELDQLVKLMETNELMAIRIEGHTDKVGDFDENLKLSLSRANAVKGYLVGKGIDFGRIETKGYGSTRPATKSTAEAERRKNRRVEFVVVKI